MFPRRTCFTRLVYALPIAAATGAASVEMVETGCPGWSLPRDLFDEAAIRAAEEGISLKQLMHKVVSEWLKRHRRELEDAC